MSGTAAPSDRDDFTIVLGEKSLAQPSHACVFRKYRFDGADLRRLPALVGPQPTVFRTLLPVVELLSRRQADEFENLSDLYRQAGITSVPEARAIRILQQLFLDAADRRLQSIYRDYFGAHPPRPGTAHDERIASLRAVRADAQSVVDSCDWHWLAAWLELDRIGEDAARCVQRLSNLAFPVSRVNFRFTYHCNIACGHCYNSSGPRLKAKRIALEPMLAVIADMPKVGIGALTLTGGEPFLYTDDLLRLIAAGRQAGLSEIKILTNAYWAATEERADRMLERLAGAGFMDGGRDHIKASTGTYHLEFVSFDRIVTLARRYHARFARRLIVDCELGPGGGALRSEILRQVREAAVAGMIHLRFRAIEAVGRATTLEQRVSAVIDEPCDDIRQIAFDPDGSVRPCCGLNSENKGVVIGRLRDQGLSALVKRMQNDPLLQFIASEPMDALFDHVPREADSRQFSGKCHLCQHAIGAMADKEALQARLFDRQRFYPFWFTLARNPSSSVSGQQEPCTEDCR